MVAPVWHSIPPERVLEEQHVQQSKGLTQQEVIQRREKYGPNELREQPRPGFLHRLINQFKDAVVLLLIAAAIISAVLGEFIESIAIVVIVALNAALGVIQEGRAERALAELKKMSAPSARVRRGGKIVDVPENEVVPGDIVLLEAGSYVPADLRLLQSANLQIDEASLTGESVPVNKKAEQTLDEDAALGDRKNMAYKSTLVTYGRGEGIVISTGMETEIGKIAEMIQAVEDEETPLQQRLNQLGRWLAYGALVLCAIVFAVAFIQKLGTVDTTTGEAFTTALQQAAVPAFLTAVALAVAAVPEGLPAVVTINLALGMQRMVERNALIRRLPAVETLGSASAICSDKTGTLTQNEMTVRRIYLPGRMLDVEGKGYEPQGDFIDDGDSFAPASDEALMHVLKAAALVNDARLEKEDGHWRIIGDPTEGALVVAAAKAGLDLRELNETYNRVDEVPFDSARKRMSTLHIDPDRDGQPTLFVKGAPDIVLERCTHIAVNGEIKPLSDEQRQHIAEVNTNMAQAALRILAVAERHYDQQPDDLDPDADEDRLVFLGLLGMIDPARPEVKPAIARARDAGIKTVMVTGDYPDTARAIAAEIGLLSENGRVVTGRELDTIEDDELSTTLDEVDVFARVSPEHKVRIVDAFRQKDFVVAMTGDGVNDAPALKRASIGVAMGITGTDVTKETADMVLTDDNYVSIVNAVEEGRVIYDNIRKFVNFLLTCNLAEIAVIFFGTLLGHPEILTPIQLLWLNLITDGAPALALGVEKGDPNVMDRKPRPPGEPIIDGVMRTGMIVQTIAKTVVTLIAFFIGLETVGEEHARSLAFIVLAFSELARAYTSRSEFYSVFKIGFFSNKWMQVAVGVSIVLLLGVIYIPFFNPIFDTVPLTLREWGIVLPLVLIPSISAEVTKLFIRQAHDTRREAAAALG
ncbi:MAG: calcium-translocating P-type ATPase, SERCA-type [Chloroflexi bacterium]|nr:calcium-translocating P-type ATPase, SERCA-type [Chloroflexota bacterium]